jgi:hypothetical protein
VHLGSVKQLKRNQSTLNYAALNWVIGALA